MISTARRLVARKAALLIPLLSVVAIAAAVARAAGESHAAALVLAPVPAPGPPRAARTLDSIPGSVAVPLPTLAGVTDTLDAPADDGPMITGVLGARTQAIVRAEIAGAVLGTLVDLGTQVRAGMPLARLQDQTQRAAHAAALADVRSAEGALVVARRRADRLARLLAGGAVSSEEAEAGAQSVDDAGSALAAARARLAGASEDLAHAVVRSPLSGVVSARSVSAGDVVQPGTALFTVLDPSTMRLEAAVPASQLAAVRAGAGVVFEVAGYPGRTFTGRVESVSPAADAATRQVPIVVSIDNRDGTLVAGLFAEGRLVAVSAPTARSR